MGSADRRLGAGASAEQKQVTSEIMPPDPWHAARVTSLTFCGLVLLLSIGFSLWAHLYRRSRVVKAGQPFFLLVLCCGTAILGLSIIPTSVVLAPPQATRTSAAQNLGVACRSIPWMICLGIFGVYAALASKMHRVNRVFNRSNRFQRVQVRVIDGIGPSLVFLALELVLLITWTASSPLEFENTDDSSACFSPDTVEYSVVLAVLNLALICYALVEAWRARKVAPLYSESSSMFVSTSHVLLAAIIAIPIILLTFSADRVSESSISVEDSAFVRAIRLFAYAALVLVCCCSNLILVFAPKMRSYRTLENEKNIERAEILHRRGLGKADDGEYRGALEDFELCLASLSDAAELITRNESLFAERVKEVVIMGGATHKSS